MKLSKFQDLTKRYPDERVQIFIDGANFYKALESERGGDVGIDYGKFASDLVGGRKLVRTNIYISTLKPEYESPDSIKKQDTFIYALQGTPFITVRKRPLRYKGKKRDREKGIDILCATDMLSQAYVNGYDSMILVSGDGDFAPVLDEIKKMGKRVENAFFKEIRSEALRQTCDVFISLDPKKLPK